MLYYYLKNETNTWNVWQTWKNTWEFLILIILHLTIQRNTFNNTEKNPCSSDKRIKAYEVEKEGKKAKLEKKEIFLTQQHMPAV